jgi:HlyD family secretion protein
VKQVRLQSATTDNVVNYTVVVSVDNTQGKLLPGMTARTNFLTKSADDVLKVANAALRYKPSEADLAALKAKRATDSVPTPDAAPRRARPMSPNGPSNFGVLYYLDAKGELAEARVTIGITDGASTEVSGKNISEGMNVIAGTVSATQQAQTSPSATPFQSGQQQGGQRRGGPSGGF